MANHPELVEAAKTIAATGWKVEQSFVGCKGEVYAAHSDLDLVVPFYAGSQGGLCWGVPPEQHLTAPLFPEICTYVLKGRRADGVWLCEIDETRAWATIRQN